MIYWKKIKSIFNKNVFFLKPVIVDKNVITSQLCQLCGNGLTLYGQMDLVQINMWCWWSVFSWKKKRFICRACVAVSNITQKLQIKLVHFLKIWSVILGPHNSHCLFQNTVNKTDYWGSSVCSDRNPLFLFCHDFTECITCHWADAFNRSKLQTTTRQAVLCVEKCSS